MILRNFGRSFCDDPITASARYLMCTDFHETTTFDGQEMSRWKHLHIDYWQNAVVNIMSVYLAGDDLLTDMMNRSVDLFMDNR